MSRIRFADLVVVAALAAATTTAWGVAATSFALGSSASVLVPITPCRLVDTRPGPEQRGPRATPAGAGEILTFAVWGANGDCDIPSTATAIASNVTVVNPTAASYLTVYPADAARPLSSNLNWTSTSQPTPNQVTVGLSATGAVSLYNLTGSIDVIIDLVGYYEPAPTGGGATGPAGAAGPAGASGAEGPAGAAGPSGPIYGRPLVTLEAVDAGVVGQESSVTVGVDELPIISYYDANNTDLRVSHCHNVTCSTATSTSVDTAGDVGRYSSITIGSDGLAIISQQDQTNRDLRVTHCNNLACTTATSSSVATAGDVGAYSSITIGTDGLPIIAHREFASLSLRVTHCNDVACTGGTTSSHGAVATGEQPDITVGIDGLAVISQFDPGALDLRVTHCNNLACSSSTTTTVDSAGNVGGYSSIAIGSDGMPIISYLDSTNSDLRVSHCGNTTCTSATTSTSVDTVGSVGNRSSITIDLNGLAIISHYDVTNGHLRLTRCSNLLCTSATSETLDAGINVGLDSSITIGADAAPLISYSDAANGNPKVAHLGHRSWTVSGWGD